MSTRYVWEQYKAVETPVVSGPEEVEFYEYFHNPSSGYGNNYAAVGSGYEVKNGEFSLTGSKSTIPFTGTSNVPSVKTFPFAIPLYSNQPKYTGDVIVTPKYGRDAGEWVAYNKSGDPYTMQIRDAVSLSDGTLAWYVNLNLYRIITEYTKGDFEGKVSGNSSKDYPDSGAVYPHYYVYLGSDTIDPYSVTYSKNEIETGAQIGISVTPRGPVYGGTIQYQFSYSTNGGSTWTNIGNKTTSLSVSVTVPQNAKQFQARAVASDAWGFTSNTPVYGPSLGVTSLKAYVGVNGKARAVSKIYVGVNGKSREVVKGYVGVDGKARKFL